MRLSRTLYAYTVAILSSSTLIVPYAVVAAPINNQAPERGAYRFIYPKGMRESRTQNDQGDNTHRSHHPLDAFRGKHQPHHTTKLPSHSQQHDYRYLNLPTVNPGRTVDTPPVRPHYDRTRTRSRDGIDDDIQYYIHQPPGSPQSRQRIMEDELSGSRVAKNDTAASGKNNTLWYIAGGIAAAGAAIYFLAEDEEDDEQENENVNQSSGSDSDNNDTPLDNPVSAAGIHPQTLAANKDDIDAFTASAEWQANPALRAMNMDAAYRRGYTGLVYERDAQGNLIDNEADGAVRIGLSDSAINYDAPDISTAINREDSVFCARNARTVNGSRTFCYDDDRQRALEDITHGTVSASVAAGRRDGENIAGIAPDADIIHAAHLDIDGSNDMRSLSYLLDEEVDVINASYGFIYEGDSVLPDNQGNIINPTFDGESIQTLQSVPIVAGSRTNVEFSAAIIGAQFASLNPDNENPYYDVLKKTQEGDTIIVAAAGNVETDNVNVLAGLPYYFRGDLGNNAPEFYDRANPENLDISGKWVAAIGLERVAGSSLSDPLKDQWRIADLPGISGSARCGVAKDWCIGAPWDYRNTLSDLAIGTSFAAPAVTGALAVLRGAFPHLNAEQITALAFGTATDLGEEGVDDIYGHGMINMEAAISPTDGNWTLATGTVFDQGGENLQVSAMAAGGAIGNALSSEATKEVMLLDSYGRNFTFTVGDLAAKASEGDTLADFARDFSAFGEDATVQRHQLTEHVSLHIASDAAPLTPLQPLNFTADVTTRPVVQRQAMMVETEGTREDSATFAFRQFYNTDAAAGVAPAVHEQAGPHVRAVSDLQRGSFSDAFSNGHIDILHDTAGAAAVSSHGNARIAFGAFAGTAGEHDVFTLDSDPLRNRAEAVGVAARYDRHHEHVGFSAQLGMSEEKDSFLESRPQGAFRLDEGARTGFASAGVTYHATDKVSLSAQYHIGVSQGQASAASLVENTDRVVSDAFSAGVRYNGITSEHDRAGVMLSQPLRVRSGSMQYRLPDAIAANGTVRYRNETANLNPSGRELNLEGYYAVAQPDKQSSVNVGVGMRFQPNHDASRDTEGLTVIKYRKLF